MVLFLGGAIGAIVAVLYPFALAGQAISKKVKEKQEQAEQKDPTTNGSLPS